MNDRVMLVAAALVLTACQAPALAPTGSQATTPAGSARPTPPGTAIVGGAFVAPVEACAGPAPWTGVPAIVMRLAEAWHEPDYQARRLILESIWNADSLYQDPYGELAIGPDALAGVMGYGVAPGQYIELRSWDPSDMHHGAIRMPWRHCCPSGLTILEGTDLLTLDADGRITENVSFWSWYVEDPAEGACDGPRIASAPSSAPSNDAATATCKGSDVDWSALPTIAQGYGKAWNERDRATRRAILDEIWADQGTYADPTVTTPIAGRDAFHDHLGTFLEAGFGAYFEPLPMADGDHHHGHVRMPWTYCDADGNIVWQGEDIADLDDEGRIARDLGFFVL